MVNLPADDSYFGVVRSSGIELNNLYGGAVFKIQDANSGVFNWALAGRSRIATIYDDTGFEITTKFRNSWFY